MCHGTASFKKTEIFIFFFQIGRNGVKMQHNIDKNEDAKRHRMYLNDKH